MIQQFYTQFAGDVCGSTLQSKSVDSLGQQFLGLLDQASRCHAGTARSSWLHRVWHGMSQTLVPGHSSEQLVWQEQLKPVSSELPVLQVQQMWAVCMVQVQVMQGVPLKVVARQSLWCGSGATWDSVSCFDTAFTEVPLHVEVCGTIAGAY